MRARGRLVVLAATVLGASFALAARADVEPPVATAVASAKQDLDLAETAYAKLDYDGANRLARLALDQRGLTHEQLARAYRVTARTYAILDHPDEARAAYVMLLTVSPDEKEDKNLPPKVTDRMAEARGVLSGYAQRPGIVAAAVVHVGEPGAIRVTLHDPTHVARHVVVAYRWGADGELTTRTSDAVDTTSVDVPPPPAGVSRFDYYALALDDHDSALFESGNADVPKSTSLALAPAPPPPRAVVHPPPSAPAPAGKSVFASPLFWAAAVGAIVVGGVVLFAATRPGSATSATLSPAVDCGSGRCN